MSDIQTLERKILNRTATQAEIDEYDRLKRKKRDEEDVRIINSHYSQSSGMDDFTTTAILSSVMDSSSYESSSSSCSSSYDSGSTFDSGSCSGGDY